MNNNKTLIHVALLIIMAEGTFVIVLLALILRNVAQ